ncbi:MAG TPA: DinB family protein [Tepidiformaceae bacterium]|nr:DinB family protein [Tepidiformaceae bacterium]
MAEVQMPNIPQDEAQRVRGYLIAQANKLSLPELVEKVRADSAQLRPAAASVPAARFNEKPGPDDWSAAEVFTHVLEMNERGAAAIESIIATGQKPAGVEDMISGATREELTTAEDYWQAFVSRREQLLAAVLKAKGDEHLDISITHPLFGPLSWREWLLFMRVHDLDHAPQIAGVPEALADPA